MTHRKITLGMIVLMLAGCGGGPQTPAGNGAAPTAQTTAASPPASAITVAAAPAPAPTTPIALLTIAGTPAPMVLVGSAYAFTPTLTAPANTASLSFSIRNPPPWAQFDPATGTLSGTPAASDVGTTAGVVIVVSDGVSTAALPGASISVVQTATGGATLSWTPPLENTDGSALTDLAGYRIYFGTSAGALTQTIELRGTGMVTTVIGNLTPATWYFAIRAYNSANVESALSSIVSKVIP